MAAGVPVVASNRGALPETVGDAGLILDIPQCYQPQTTLLPSAEEVQNGKGMRLRRRLQATVVLLIC